MYEGPVCADMEWPTYVGDSCHEEVFLSAAEPPLGHLHGDIGDRSTPHIG
jgi:hypothetical protein